MNSRKDIAVNIITDDIEAGAAFVKHMRRFAKRYKRRRELDRERIGETEVRLYPRPPKSEGDEEMIVRLAGKGYNPATIHNMEEEDGSFRVTVEVRNDPELAGLLMRYLSRLDASRYRSGNGRASYIIRHYTDEAHTQH